MEELQNGSRIVVEGEDGETKEMIVLFRFTSEENQKNYLFLVENEDDENVILCEYVEDGEEFVLKPVEDEKTLAMGQEVLDSFDEDLEPIEKE
ncbi:MAG: DUF1292 domain-containing protein [Bacilli bacterium]